MRARSLGYNISQYLQHLMRLDLRQPSAELPRVAEPAADDYGKPKMRVLYREVAAAGKSRSKPSGTPPSGRKAGDK